MKIKKNNKFFKIFNSLSDSEIKEFCEFLRLSFIIKPRLSNVIIEKIESEKDLHLYLKSKYSERSLWNIYSELTRSLCEYLSLKEIIINEKEMKKLKRMQLHKRDLGKILINDYKIDIKNLKSSEFSFYTFNDIHFAANNCLIELIKTGLSKEFYEISKISSDFLILRSFFEMILFNLEDRIRKEFYGEKSDLLNQYIFNVIDTKKIQKIIIEQYPDYKNIFKLIFNMYYAVISPENYSNFKKAKEGFLKDINIYSLKFRAEVFIVLINISNLISNRTKRDMNSEMFELLKSKIDSGLTDDLKISKIGENHFRDYIYVALKVNEDKWAEDFLNKYSSLLHPSLKENNINTALAFINYHRKNYVLAVTHIKKLKRRIFINDLDFYSIQIFSAFDSGNIVDCVRTKKRFQEYVKSSSQLPDVYKSGIINFLKSLSALIRYKETGKNKNLTELQYIILNSNELLWRFWLTNKLNELKQ